MGFIDTVKNKKVVFITTKNIDYIRNTQEINMLRNVCTKLEVIGAEDKGYFNRLRKVYGHILKTKFADYDSVFIGFAPQLVLPLFFTKFKGNKIIIDFFISLFDTYVFDRKKVAENSILAKILFYIDKKTLKLADEIVVDTRAHGEYFINTLGCDEKKVEVLYLEADRQIYHPVEKIKKNFTVEKFTVLYFGSILPLQGVDVVLDAIELLKDCSNIYFNIIGPLPKENKPLSENVLCYEWLEQEQLAKKIAEADLCLAGHFASNIDKAKRTIPGKAYIYKAMAKEMILGDNPANHEIFSENDDLVHFVKMGDAQALAKKIREIAEDKRNLYYEI